MLLVNQLQAANKVNAEQNAALIPVFAHGGHSELFKIHEDLLDDYLATYESLSSSFRLMSFFKNRDQGGIEFVEEIDCFDSRTAALRRVIERIDRKDPTKYSLDHTRPLGGTHPLSSPLVNISRPYCRDHHDCLTHCVYGLIQREDGKYLIQRRGTQMNKDGSTSRINNYENKIDLSIGAAHLYDGLANNETEAILRTLMAKGNGEVGLKSEDVQGIEFLGSTTFRHTRDNNVYQNEHHITYLVQVSNDFTPEFRDNDVAEAVWVTGEELLALMRNQDAAGFVSPTFSRNSYPAAIQAAMHPGLSIITPDTISPEEYAAFEEYYNDPRYVPQNDIFHQEWEARPSDITIPTHPARR